MKWLVPQLFFAVIFTVLTPYGGVAQNHLQENEYQYRLYNGLDFYFINESADPLVTLSLTIKAGVFGDNDSLHGVTYEYNKAFSANLEAWAKSNNILYRNVYQRERITYIFQFAPSMAEKVLELLAEKLSAPEKISPATIPTSMHENIYPIDLPESFMEKGKKMLWGDFYSRTTLTDDSLPKDTAAIRQVYPHYYGADNALMLIRGNISSREIYPIIQNTITGWKTRKHNYFLENPVPYPKDMKFSSQFVEENDSAKRPLFVVWLRGPGSLQDREYYLLSPLLEETFRVSSLSKAFTDTSHIADLNLHIDNGRYASQIMIEMTPDTGKTDSAYYNLAKYFRYSGDGRMFTAADLEKAKLNLAEKFEKAKKDPIQQANIFADYWCATAVDDYSLYVAQIKAVTIEQLCAYTHKYMLNQPFVAGLYINKSDRATLKTDSFFTNTGNIEDYHFTFVKNNADLVDTTIKDSLLRSMAQTIKINPQMRVMLNGVAAKDELLHLSDESMLNFMNQHPGFIITPASLIPSKKIRLDVYRALILIKSLIEMGVPESQLSGTGKIVESGTMLPMPDQQVYCTFNLY